MRQIHADKNGHYLRLSISVCCLLFAVCFLLFVVSANADEAASLFHQANQQYEAGNYKQAAETYEKILAAGKANWQLYYNLGNAYYKQRQIGKAILNYERARRLNRNNEDILFNLDLANLSVADRIPAMPRSLAVVWLDKAIHLFTLAHAAILALIFWVLFFIGAIIWLLARREFARKFGRGLFWSCGAVWLIFALLFAILAYERATVHEAIVLAPRVVVRSSPAEDATEMFILHEGVKVRLQESSGDWRRIKLADGKVGWLEAKTIEGI
ncbi:MAG: SH3 domain-containing protein [candidate division KSB1 bacterium]|nr:SH3 domain-containing protein [candidate division KSB1 bacterium]MDZ7304831.1 SH3 domain-containing protein [candidate division KSB1 bacterium]MDZ7313911.1 SH3 domain-containing protein [candidate division KSB1 bacterium]